MTKFKFDKLVRDKIIEHQLASGAKPNYRRLSPQEHKQALVDKVIEEAHEITHADEGEVAAEIADVQQAIDDLKELLGITSEEVVKEQQLKNSKNGSFKKGIYVNHVEVDDQGAWAAYYRKNADRYPEIG